ncbi:hypothetical protein SynBIOSE41_03417 [Synechococcus sp. BIOS-E4-1]|nr:hypothetical protein SynBIOSE41_03417 [Synechococcus sp. BIOS-E4-1]
MMDVTERIELDSVGLTFQSCEVPESTLTERHKQQCKVRHSRSPLTVGRFG